MISTRTIFTTYDGKEFTKFQDAKDHEKLRLTPCRYCEKRPKYEVGGDFVMISCCDVRVDCGSRERTNETVAKSLAIADQTARDKWNTIMKVEVRGV